MDLSETRDKLTETKFFLTHLREEQGQHGRRGAAAFRYYLSAFFNSAYSVTEYLEFEEKRELKRGAVKHKQSSKQAKGKYTRLYSQWEDRLSGEDRQVWDFMRSRRGAEVHTRRTKTVTKVNIIPTDDLSRNRLHPAYQSMMISPPALFSDDTVKMKRRRGLPPWVNAWSKALEHHFAIEGEQRDVVKTCGRYVALLERLVVHGEQTAVR